MHFFFFFFLAAVGAAFGCVAARNAGYKINGSTIRLYHGIMITTCTIFFIFYLQNTNTIAYLVFMLLLIDATQ